jgi:predicted 3-demethylubiquinone-9 3-methyltransferase (glyoxalase superfamily)
MATLQRITPCLWFADEAEEAARYYTGIFENPRITTITPYGLSWQVVPDDMDELFADAESPAAQRAMEAMLRMKKLDVAELRRAHAGAA